LRSGRNRGFTLIEIMAVVMIFVLIAAVVGPRITQLSSQTLSDEGKQLAATLDFTRGKALALGRPHRVMLDLDNAQYWIEAQPPTLAPEPVLAWAELEELPLVAPRDERGDFAPLAGVSGRPVALRSGVRLAGLDSDVAGSARAGVVAVEFAADGSASAAVISLENSSGMRVTVSVAPFADPTRVAFDAPQ
jgi:prepilin-type N-terminal cleavage/methylation domain-containing protein